jgi:hypothetical protein
MINIWKLAWDLIKLDLNNLSGSHDYNRFTCSTRTNQPIRLHPTEADLSESGCVIRSCYFTVNLPAFHGISESSQKENA